MAKCVMTKTSLIFGNVELFTFLHLAQVCLAIWILNDINKSIVIISAIL